MARGKPKGWVIDKTHKIIEIQSQDWRIDWEKSYGDIDKITVTNLVNQDYVSGVLFEPTYNEVEKYAIFMVTNELHISKEDT